MIDSWTASELGLVADIRTGKLDSNQSSSGGAYPFFTCAPEPFRIDHFAFDCDAVLLAGNNANGVFHLNRYRGKFNAYQRTYVITSKASEAVDLGFLFYLLHTLTSRLGDYSQGSATKFLTMKILSPLPITLPPLPEQRAIAHILGTFDDKIEVNRRMSETLEGIARALFKSWFVDFDPVRAKAEGRQPVGMDAETAALFPDSFQDSELGLIPKGWSLGAFADIVTQHKQQVTPEREPEVLFLHHSIPAFDNGKRPITEKGEGIGSNKFTVPEESVLISRLNPRIPRVWLIPNSQSKNRVCSTEFFVAIPRNGWSQSFVYSLAQSESFIESLQSMVTGTSGSHQRVRPGDVGGLQVTMPPSQIGRHFQDIVGPLVKRVEIATDESEALARIRNTLLPKLISGELRVPDAEKLLAESPI